MSRSYVAPFWLPGGHLQTIFPLLLPRPATDYRRERWNLPDGDFLDLDWVDGPAGSPRLVLFHGLEGDSRSHYALALMTALKKRNWSGVVAHFRGCSGEPNRLPRAYHSGDSAEIDFVLRRLRSGRRALFAVGVSLGGNALLKWLGEQGAGAEPVVLRAAAVSAPVDLSAAGRVLDRGFNRLYTIHFLSTLKPKALGKLDAHDLPCDRDAIRNARTLHAFDTLFTAPLHGFRDADDYWTRSASKPWLAHIRVPTLMINARNDPFLPAAALPGAEEVSERVTLEFPETGGHVGFVSGAFPGHLDWLPNRVLEFFTDGFGPAGP